MKPAAMTEIATIRQSSVIHNFPVVEGSGQWAQSEVGALGRLSWVPGRRGFILKNLAHSEKHGSTCDMVRSGKPGRTVTMPQLQPLGTADSLSAFRGSYGVLAEAINPIIVNEYHERSKSTFRVLVVEVPSRRIARPESSGS